MTNPPSGSTVEQAREIIEEVEKFAAHTAPDDHELTTPHVEWVRAKIDALIAAVRAESHQVCNDQIDMLTKANFSLQSALSRLKGHDRA